MHPKLAKFARKNCCQIVYCVKCDCSFGHDCNGPSVLTKVRHSFQLSNYNLYSCDACSYLLFHDCVELASDVVYEHKRQSRTMSINFIAESNECTKCMYSCTHQCDRSLICKHFTVNNRPVLYFICTATASVAVHDYCPTMFPSRHQYVPMNRQIVDLLTYSERCRELVMEGIRNDRRAHKNNEGGACCDERANINERKERTVIDERKITVSSSSSRQRRESERNVCTNCCKQKGRTAKNRDSSPRQRNDRTSERREKKMQTLKPPYEMSPQIFNFNDTLVERVAQIETKIEKFIKQQIPSPSPPPPPPTSLPLPPMKQNSGPRIRKHRFVSNESGARTRRASVETSYRGQREAYRRSGTVYKRQ